MTQPDLAGAARILKGGGLVAFPTETVYGLGADGLSAEAVARIFEAKGRPADNPLILHVANVDAALALWDIDAPRAEQVRALARAFWPGPLTIVLPAAGRVPALVRADLPTVGVRVPNHPLALELLEVFGGPLAAPSANASGRPSPTRAEHVHQSLGARVECVLDGGPTRVGLESTVVDLSGAWPQVLRPGAVSAVEIGRVLDLDLATGGRDDDTLRIERSPGTRHEHYVPAGLEVQLVDSGAVEGAWAGPDALVVRAGTAEACRERLGARSALTEVLPDDAEGFARGFYAALHAMEGVASGRLLLEDVPESDAWQAVRDRLHRAAGVR